MNSFHIHEMRPSKSFGSQHVQQCQRAAKRSSTVAFHCRKKPSFDYEILKWRNHTKHLKITYKYVRTVRAVCQLLNTLYIYYSYETERVGLQCRKHSSAHNMSTQSTSEITRSTNDRWLHVSQDAPPNSLSLFAFRKHTKWKRQTVKINGINSKEKSSSKYILNAVL